MEPVPRSLKVSGLSPRTTTEAIELFFESPRNGGREECIDQVDHRPATGLAFLTLETAEDALKVISRCTDAVLDGAPISVKIHLPDTSCGVRLSYETPGEITHHEQIKELLQAEGVLDDVENYYASSAHKTVILTMRDPGAVQKVCELPSLWSTDLVVTKMRSLPPVPQMSRENMAPREVSLWPMPRDTSSEEVINFLGPSVLNECPITRVDITDIGKSKVTLSFSAEPNMDLLRSTVSRKPFKDRMISVQYGNSEKLKRNLLLFNSKRQGALKGDTEKGTVVDLPTKTRNKMKSFDLQYPHAQLLNQRDIKSEVTNLFPDVCVEFTANNLGYTLYGSEADVDGAMRFIQNASNDVNHLSLSNFQTDLLIDEQVQVFLKNTLKEVANNIIIYTVEEKVHACVSSTSASNCLLGVIERNLFEESFYVPEAILHSESGYKAIEKCIEDLGHTIGSPVKMRLPATLESMDIIPNATSAIRIGSFRRHKETVTSRLDLFINGCARQEVDVYVEAGLFEFLGEHFTKRLQHIATHEDFFNTRVELKDDRRLQIIAPKCLMKEVESRANKLVKGVTHKVLPVCSPSIGRYVLTQGAEARLRSIGREHNAIIRVFSHQDEEPYREPTYAEFKEVSQASNVDSSHPFYHRMSQNCLLIGNNIYVTLVHGKLSTEMVDVVVNFVESQSKDIVNGGWNSRELIEGAGPEIQDTYKRKKLYKMTSTLRQRHAVSEGILRTPGCKLPCKEVFHVGVPDWVNVDLELLKVFNYNQRAIQINNTS